MVVEGVNGIGPDGTCVGPHFDGFCLDHGLHANALIFEGGGCS